VRNIFAGGALKASPHIYTHTHTHNPLWELTSVYNIQHRLVSLSLSLIILDIIMSCAFYRPKLSFTLFDCYISSKVRWRSHYFSTCGDALKFSDVTPTTRVGSKYRIILTYKDCNTSYINIPYINFYTKGRIRIQTLITHSFYFV
jgi:hypothetical protein